MDITPLNIRTLSILGQRGAYGLALTELAEEHPEIIALTADLCNTSGLDRFVSKFPDRLYNVGIAEQNMIGIAAGLAAGGNIPFVSTFANFATLRSCEQIRHFLGYMQENVKVVGLGAGFSMGMFGTTHYGLEDIATIRSMNNIIILSPADSLEVVKSVRASALIGAPVYLRLSGTMNMPVVYKNDYDFQIGEAITIKDGHDVAIIATGTMVSNTIKASTLLENDGISVKIINMHTIKPIDVETIKNVLDYRLIVSVEEHSKIGGLGSAVAEVLTGYKRQSVQMILGTDSIYKKAGDYKYMIDEHGLSPEKIYQSIKNKYLEVAQ